MSEGAEVSERKQPLGVRDGTEVAMQSPGGRQSAAPSSSPPLPPSDGEGPVARDQTSSFSKGAQPKITWPSHYRRFGWVDGVVSGTFGAAAVTAAVIGPRFDGPTGGLLLDDDVRRVLRPDEFRGRMLAQDLSDVFLGFSATYAFIGDPLVNAGWLRESKDVGRQIFFMNLEVATVTLGLQQVAANGISRERPYGRICGTEELDSRTINCEGDDRYRSHFSGHTAFSFAMAAATCTHHSFLPLSNDKTWLTCAAGFANAMATAWLRVVGDKHYVTDIAVGAGVGSLIGWGLPFLHYSTGLRPLQTKVGDVQLMVVPQVGGASLLGIMP